MKFTPQSIPDVILIEPTVHGDNRGYFVENFRQDLFEKTLGYKVNFIQDNESKSTKGVLRGLHYQLPPYAQAKLVRVIEGSVLDIVVDIRKSSPTFGQYVAIELTADNKRQVFVPHGFAHGFVVLSDSATFIYKVDNYYAPKHDRGIAFNDQDLAIDWQLPLELLQLSEKDKMHPTLANSKDLFK
ncbi:dTDP-4-dehydrorhamnose 3,5-epimerase [Candidatus Thioglobus sp.]|uniref:dTDP-4-dehydrorhamnose 3,5-epimerase n=1 Tax=Candidatus Thioglobus sp. TaxID=2026721 RepID=UPI003D0A6581